MSRCDPVMRNQRRNVARTCIYPESASSDHRLAMADLRSAPHAFAHSISARPAASRRWRQTLSEKLEIRCANEVEPRYPIFCRRINPPLTNCNIKFATGGKRCFFSSESLQTKMIILHKQLSRNQFNGILVAIINRYCQSIENFPQLRKKRIHRVASFTVFTRILNGII